MSGRISAYGISAELPPGWDGRIYRPGRREVSAGERAPDATSSTAAADGGAGYPVAHLANFPMPEDRGDYGSGAVERMGPRDVLVCLLEFDGEAVSTPLFARVGIPRFQRADFSPSTMQRTIAGMCGAQAFFSEQGRAFCTYAVLGSYRMRAPLVPDVNRVLAGVRIEPA